MEPDEIYAFNAQWFQSEASVMHDFLLNYFSADNSVELIDTKTRKAFLRRSEVGTVCVKDLVPGSRVFVFGRKIHILDYMDESTRSHLGSKSQRAFLLVPGQCKRSIDRVFQKISSLNLNLNSCYMKQLSSDDLVRVNLLEDERIADVKYNLLNEPSVIFELAGKSVEKKVEDIQEDCPGVFGTSAVNILDYFFKTPTGKQAITRNEESVLCLIKPHAVHANQTGDILAQIFKEGFVLANLKLCHMDRNQCDEFLRVYEGVAPEFIQMSIHLASGPLLALQLTGREEDIHSKLRNLCGPHDPDIARKLRPHTLRAAFGVNTACNAVHCTDLKEDAALEVNFFFN